MIFVALQVLFRDVGTITCKIDVVLQFIPGNGVLSFAQPKKSAERDDRGADLTTYLLDHQPFDRSDMVVVGIVHVGALHAVALDQWFSCHCSLPGSGIGL